MTALISSLLANPTLLAIGGGIIAALLAFIKGRSAGRQAERDKQAGERLKAREIADEVDNDIGAMPPDQAREDLKKWGK